MIKSMLVRNAQANAAVRLVDVGSDMSSGRIDLFSTTDATICRLILPRPAFMDATDATCAAYPISDATSLFDGTISWFSVVDRDATEVWNGTVSMLSGAGDLKLNSLAFPKDSTVTITSALFAVPA